MRFQIEEVIPIEDGRVEVRARLEDGRLVCMTTEKGDGQDVYAAQVNEYLTAAFPPEPAQGENGEE